MSWLLFVGGEACWPGGQKVNRNASLCCSSEDLSQHIHDTFIDIYSIDKDYDPPLSTIDTWAFGLHLNNQSLLNDLDLAKELLAKYKLRLERLGISEYEQFFEDRPEGSGIYKKLTREECQKWLEAAKLMADDGTLYEFSNRPQNFPKAKMITSSTKGSAEWTAADAESFVRSKGVKRKAKAPPQPPQLDIYSNAAEAVKRRRSIGQPTAAAIPPVKATHSQHTGSAISNSSSALKSEDVPVQCGEVLGLWSANDPRNFLVTKVPVGVKKPNHKISGTEFEALAGKSYAKNWKFNIKVKLPDGTLGIGAYLTRLQAPRAIPSASLDANGKKESPIKSPIAVNPQNHWSEKQVSKATALKKKELLDLFLQLKYPIALAQKIIEQGIFKPAEGKDGHLIIKFSVMLPDGSRAGCKDTILRCPYILKSGTGGSIKLFNNENFGGAAAAEESSDDVDNSENGSKGGAKDSKGST